MQQSGPPCPICVARQVRGERCRALFSGFQQHRTGLFRHLPTGIIQGVDEHTDRGVIRDTAQPVERVECGVAYVLVGILCDQARQRRDDCVRGITQALQRSQRGIAQLRVNTAIGNKRQ